MDQKQHTILIYTHYYPDSELPARDLEKIRGIDRDNVLRFLLAMRTSVARHRGPNIKNPFINRFSDNLPAQHRERLLRFLAHADGAYFLTVPVIITQIIIDILNEPAWENDPGKNNEYYFTVSMLEVIMLYNDHHFKSLDIGKRDDSHELIWEMMLMQEINGDTSGSFVRSGVAKQAIFLEFLRSALAENYEEFEKEVCSMLGVKSIGAYAVMFLVLQIVQDRAQKESMPLISLSEQDEMYAVAHHAKLVIDVETSDRKFDAGKVLTHPFLKLSDKRLYLMGTHDFSLITEKGWVFYLFLSGKLSMFLPKIKSVNDLLSFIGFSYIEKFLMVPIFQSLGRPGFRINPSDDTLVPDVTLINNEKDVFLIEIKSVSLNYKVWEDQDLGKFKSHLESQYIREKKGVIQLHKCIGNLVKSPVELYGIHKDLKKINIYPIIIYTEPHLNIVGVNDYVNQNAPELPVELSEKFQTVYPVTMIHYDFFIENLNVIRRDKGILKDAIIHYHSSLKRRLVKWSGAKSTSNYLKAMAPFDDFIAGYKGLYEVGKDTIARELNAIFNPNYKSKVK